MGEEMGFKDEERSEAATVTNKYMIEHVGVIGSVGGHDPKSSVIISDSLINIGYVRELLNQIEGIVEGLPNEIREDVRRCAADLKREVTSESPDQSRIQKLLLTLRRIAEGAGGNLTATGIVQIIARLLGLG